MLKNAWLASENAFVITLLVCGVFDLILHDLHKFKTKAALKCLF